MYREGGTKFGPNGQTYSEPHNKEQEAQQGPWNVVQKDKRGRQNN